MKLLVTDISLSIKITTFNLITVQNTDMSQATLESKTESLVNAEQDIVEKRRENRQKDQFIGEFGDATIQNVINDEEKLDDDVFIKFELLMPDYETTRYLSFSEKQVNGNMFDEFLDYLDTSEHNMNVLYKKIPVTYAEGEWRTSFRTDILAEQTRKGTFFSIAGNTGMFILTRWSYLTLTILAGIISAILYVFNTMEAIQFVWIVFASIIFTPIFTSAYEMDRMYTGLVTLYKE